MSRLGKTPIDLPEKVEVKIANAQIHVKGPKGNVTQTCIPGIGVKIEDQRVFVTADEAANISNRDYGLHRAIINNLIIGVSKGFEIRLSLIGVGYRAAVQGQMLDLQLGFSHPTKVVIPKGVNVVVEKSVLIIITGIDKHLVGQFAATVRAMKPPEPYKGKGIRYENEFVRKKAGKAAKGKTA
jgi:large subunit ribosomal protein L6